MCTGGVEGDVCIPMGVRWGGGGGGKGMCTYLWVCTGGVEGDVYIPMGVRWGC